MKFFLLSLLLVFSSFSILEARDLHVDPSDGDDGISAHETAQYRVDGFVSIGNGTGICDTGGSQTSYNNLFIADCLGVDLYFLNKGKYSISNGIVLSSAQKPMMVLDDSQLNVDNLFIRRLGDSVPALIANRAKLHAKRLTLDQFDVRGGGDVIFDAKASGCRSQRSHQNGRP